MQETHRDCKLKLQTIKQSFWGQTENLIHENKAQKSRVDCAKYTLKTYTFEIKVLNLAQWKSESVTDGLTDGRTNQPTDHGRCKRTLRKN